MDSRWLLSSTSAVPTICRLHIAQFLLLMVNENHIQHCADSKTFWFIEIRPFWAKLWKDKVEIDRTVCMTELMRKCWLWHYSSNVHLQPNLWFSQESCCMWYKFRYSLLKFDGHIEYSISHLPMDSKESLKMVWISVYNCSVKWGKRCPWKKERSRFFSN